jgi:hypothetical protein
MTGVIWTDEFMDGMRLVGDRVVDDAISEVYDLGVQDRVRDILHDFDENMELVPAGLPPLLTAYFEQAATLPPWADPVRMERGNKLLGAYAPHVITCLMCYSLPICYACDKGVQVLYRSTRLTDDVFRRIGETAQFVVDAMQPYAFGPGGRGRRSAQKIRLLHTTIRHHVSRLDDWDPAFGVPINQEDLAGTLGSFSTAVILGLGKLGVRLTPEECEDYFHVWRVIGDMLGLVEPLNPDNFADGRDLLDLITTRQWSSSVAGTTLSDALLGFMQRPLEGLEGLPPSLLRHLAGDECADILGVPPADWTALGIELASSLTWFVKEMTNEDHVQSKLASHLGLSLLNAGLRLTNRGERYVWRVPTGLGEPFGTP